MQDAITDLEMAVEQDPNSGIKKELALAKKKLKQSKQSNKVSILAMLQYTPASQLLLRQSSRLYLRNMLERHTALELQCAEAVPFTGSYGRNVRRHV